MCVYWGQMCAVIHIQMSDDTHAVLTPLLLTYVALGWNSCCLSWRQELLPNESSPWPLSYSF